MHSRDIPEWALPGLEEALERTEAIEDIGEIQLAVEDYHAQVWENGKACLITRIVPFKDPAKPPEVHIILATGELEAALEVADFVEEWARQAGASGLSLIGRPGWLRVLPDRGWKEVPVRYMTKKF